MFSLKGWVIDVYENYYALSDEINQNYGFLPDSGGQLISFSENKTGNSFYLGSNTIAVIKTTQKVQRLLIKNALYAKVDFDFTTVLPSAKIVELKSEPLYTVIETQLEDDLTDCIKPYLDRAIQDYKPSKSFACCSRYVECSDAKKCLHPQQIYAKQCWYRENLEKGNIFYGKNKT